MSFTSYAAKQAKEREADQAASKQKWHDSIVAKHTKRMRAFLSRELGPEVKGLKLGAVTRWSDNPDYSFHSECCAASVLTMSGRRTGVRVMTREDLSDAVEDPDGFPKAHFEREGFFLSLFPISSVSAARKIDKALKREG